MFFRGTLTEEKGVRRTTFQGRYVAPVEKISVLKNSKAVKEEPLSPGLSSEKGFYPKYSECWKRGLVVDIL